MGKLSAVKVQKLREPGRYADGDNLWPQIGNTGGKSWAFRYMLNGRARQMGLGPVALVNLAEAREIAIALLGDTAERFLAAAGVLFRHQCNPG